MARGCPVTSGPDSRGRQKKKSCSETDTNSCVFYEKAIFFIGALEIHATMMWGVMKAI